MAALSLSYNLFYPGELFAFYLPTALTSAETDFKLRTSSFKLGSLSRVRSRGARRNVNHTNLPLSSGARTGVRARGLLLPYPRLSGPADPMATVAWREDGT